ncbi:MAG: anti-sigma factor family protein [Actinomycetes bacterium]
MSHLGDRVAALVDGEVRHDERDRLLAHVAGCPSCHAEVEAVRAVKQRTSALGGPAPSDALTARLRALGEPGEPLPPTRPRMPGGSSRPLRTATLRAPRTPRGAGGATASRTRRLSLVAASFAAGTLTTAFLVGGEQPSSSPPVVPPVDQFAVEHAGTSGDIPLTDPAAAAVTVGGPSSPASGVGTFGTGADRAGLVPSSPVQVSPLVVPVFR